MLMDLSYCIFDVKYICIIVGMESSISKSPTQKYWREASTAKQDDIVVIHVADENRGISKDFYCKRDILVKHMKYFEAFLAENENGYDDIDISVHCDVEIFEWLMAYIHEPDTPPNLEKTMVVSILISSEFLQMDVLVDICLQHISANLTDIIKLPIDLSCISEKLINKLAFMTPPKVLCEAKDRKDKILNKLYKRRVELDFSRKTGSRGSVKGTRTIASTLTCCKYCGYVYLENYVCMLTCRAPDAPAVVDYRGKWAKCHDSIKSWSLTSYLKGLHAAGMSWEAIYWHAWAACVVIQVGNVYISVLECDRYIVCAEDEALHISNKSIHSKEKRDLPFSLELGDDYYFAEETGSDSHVVTLSPSKNGADNAGASSRYTVYHLRPTAFIDPQPNTYITPSLSPQRPASVLTHEIYQLIVSQMKFIADPMHRELYEKIGKQQLAPSEASGGDDNEDFNYYDAIYSEPDDICDSYSEDDRRGRSRSPGRGPTATSIGSRKSTLSISTSGKNRGKSIASASTSSNGNGNTLCDNNDAVSDSNRRRASSVSSIRSSRRSRSSSRSAGIANGSNPISSISTGSGNSKKHGNTSPRGKSARSRSKPKSTVVKDSFVATSVNEEGGNEEDYLDLLDDIYRVFRDTPPEVSRGIRSVHGHMYGVWLTEAHPLALHSNQQLSLLNYVREGNHYCSGSAPAVASQSTARTASPVADGSPTGAVAPAPITTAPTNATNAKKLEWQLDLMRDFDEKRLNKMHAYLFAQRSRNVNASAPNGTNYYNHSGKYVVYVKPWKFLSVSFEYICNTLY